MYILLLVDVKHAGMSTSENSLNLQAVGRGALSHEIVAPCLRLASEQREQSSCQPVWCADSGSFRRTTGKSIARSSCLNQ